MRLSSAPHCGHDECARPLAASAPFYFETFALHLVVRDEEVFDLRDEVLAEIAQLADRPVCGGVGRDGE